MQSVLDDREFLWCLVDRAQGRALTMTKPQPAKWIKRPTFWCLCLLAFGMILLNTSRYSWSLLRQLPMPVREGSSALGEALVIAAILALFVDPFLKDHLLREASKNIFEHLLGFDQEPEIRQKLKEVAFQTTLYRRNFRIEYRLEPLGNDRVSFHINNECHVINPTPSKRPYQAQWTFNPAESPGECQASFVMDDGSISDPKTYDCSTLPNGHLQANADSVDIPPLDAKGRRYFSSISCQAPRDWFHVFYFGLPTIDVTVVANAPEGWTVWVLGQKFTKTNKTLWHNPGLYMPA